MSATPTLPRRGPLHGRLAPHARAWREVNGYQVCAAVAVTAGGADPWLLEQSHLPRFGLKGRGAAEWLAGEGLAVPPLANRWCTDASSVLVARLGAQDFLLEEDAGGTRLGTLAARWAQAGGRRGHPLPRQHGLASFLLGGTRASELLARLCAVDLRPARFAADAVAQTQVALCNATVLRTAHDTPRYRLYVDTSLALYLWDRLHEVGVALGGCVLGIDQLSQT